MHVAVKTENSTYRIEYGYQKTKWWQLKPKRKILISGGSLDQIVFKKGEEIPNQRLYVANNIWFTKNGEMIMTVCCMKAYLDNTGKLPTITILEEGWEKKDAIRTSEVACIEDNNMIAKMNKRGELIIDDKDWFKKVINKS